MKKTILVLLFTILFPIIGYTFPISPILDQSHDYVGQYHKFAPISETQTLSQSFTSGYTGSLANIDILFEKTFFQNTIPPLLIEIREMGFGSPYGTLLGTASIDNFVIPGRYGEHIWKGIDLQSSQIHLEQGVQYSIVLKSTGYYSLPVTSYLNTDYSGGNIWYEKGGTVYDGGSDDIAFRTFMAPDSIPEPATALLFVFGLVGAGILKQYKK